MSLSAHFVAVVASGAAGVPAGWIGVIVARHETPGAQIPLCPMIAANVVAFAWAAAIVPVGYLLLATFLLGWTLLVLCAVDAVSFRLPDVLTLPNIGAGLLLSLVLPDRNPVAHLIGAAVGFAALYAIAWLYRRTRGREGLGLGDAKLTAAAGAWLGWQALPSVILMACFAGLIWIGVGTALRGRAALHQQIAFGLPLCFAFWLVWLYGPPF